MSVFVFSDTHFTRRFDEKRFQKLASLIEKSDMVIINGDFWEGLSVSFDDFINSEWKKLFQLLKAKKAVYVFGNHDDPVVSDKRIYEFCDVAVREYKYETPTRTYYFTHGQEFLYPKMKDPESARKRALKLLTKMDIFVAGITQSVIFTIGGSKILPEKFNYMTLEQRKRIAPIEYLLVCGHSHRPMYQPKLNFIDIGFFNYGWANYMLIDDMGEFKFVSEKY